MNDTISDDKPAAARTDTNALAELLTKLSTHTYDPHNMAEKWLDIHARVMRREIADALRRNAK